MHHADYGYHTVIHIFPCHPAFIFEGIIVANRQRWPKRNWI